MGEDDENLRNHNYYDSDIRIEVFDIADDETLIGCELEQSDKFFVGVTWLKWKTPS